MSDDLEGRLAAALSSHRPARLRLEGAREAAVLIPLYPAPEPTVIFTLRTDALSSHRGQISFPGGRVDPADPSFAAAALRETAEELGIDPSVVRILGELDTTPTFVSGYTVTPYVGWLDERPRFDPNPAEVAEVIEVPLEALNETIRRDPGFSHGGRTYPTEAWVWEGHVIWGVTARVVRGLLQVLGRAGLVSPPSEHDPWDAFRAGHGARR